MNVLGWIPHTTTRQPIFCAGECLSFSSAENRKSVKVRSAPLSPRSLRCSVFRPLGAPRLRCHVSRFVGQTVVCMAAKRAAKQPFLAPLQLPRGSIIAHRLARPVRGDDGVCRKGSQ